MKKIIILTMLSAIIGAGIHISASASGTVYVSSSGSAENTGASAAEPTTLEKAYSLADSIDTIVLVDDITYSEAPAHDGVITIKGNTSDVVLTTSANISVKGDIIFSNLTLSGGVDVFANGYNLIVDEAVTSQNAINVFGGCNGKDYTGDTNITILGGTYTYIQGGSNKATVNGSSNVTVGGNTVVTEIYGGGYNSTVTKSANITLKGNAECEYVFGTNRLTTDGISAPENVNINITGGTVTESIYGGTARYDISDCNIHITMTGGKTESIFGGSNKANVTGNIYIDIFGGEVTRRVYTGCYNEYDNPNSIFKYEWLSSYYVKGSTILRLKNGANLITNASETNRGIFLGSRIGSNPSDEKNTLIYLDDCYSTYSGKIGEQGYLNTNVFKSYADYVIKAGVGGDVKGTDIAGTVYAATSLGEYAILNNAETAYENENITLSASENTIEFKTYNFKIHDVKAYTGSEKITATVTLSAQNNGDIVYSSPVAVVAVFNENGRFVTAATNREISGCNSYTFILSDGIESETEYVVKAMIFNEDNMLSLADSYTVNTSTMDDGYELWQGIEQGTQIIKLDYSKDLVDVLR